MEFKALQRMFQNGALTHAIVALEPLGTNYQLLLKTARGGYEPLTKVRSNEAKGYKAIESAIHDAEKIGFKTVTVELEKMAS